MAEDTLAVERKPNAAAVRRRGMASPRALAAHGVEKGRAAQRIETGRAAHRRAPAP